jgi:hypothetical protein
MAAAVTVVVLDADIGRAPLRVTEDRPRTVNSIRN